MQSFFKEIYEYHHHLNQQLIAEVKQHQTALPERSFPLLCHMLNAHQIWNARILSLEPFLPQQMQDINFCPKLDDDNYQNTLQILDTTDFEKMIAYTNSRGETYTNKVQDILFHAANHFTHHRAQIMSDFRASGIAPLVTDYIFGTNILDCTAA